MGVAWPRSSEGKMGGAGTHEDQKNQGPLRTGAIDCLRKKNH